MSRRFSLLLCLLAVCLLASSADSVYAQSKSGSVLFVAPHRLIIDPSERVDVLNVSNNSDEARRYDLTLVDQVMGPDGVTVRKKTFPYSIKRMVKFVPKRFSLQPGEKQTVRVMVKRPKDLPDGDYHSHLLFREVPLSVKDKDQLAQESQAATKTLSFEIRTLYGLAVPIVVQHGKLSSSISITDTKLGKNDEGKYTLSVSFLREGNAEANAKLYGDYVAPGAEPVQVFDGQWIRIYREADKITKNQILSGLDPNTKGGKLVLRFVKDEDDDSKTEITEIAVP